MTLGVGVIGLGVMGRNLALNAASKGFSVAGYEADAAKAVVEAGRFTVSLVETKPFSRKDDGNSWARLGVNDPMEILGEKAEKANALRQFGLGRGFKKESEATVERIGEWMSGLWPGAEKEADHAAA